jgi:hypothetical protein
MPLGRRHSKDGIKEIRSRSFNFDGSSHQAGTRPYPRHDPKKSALEANTDPQNPHNTQQSRAKQNALLLYAKGHSAQPGIFWRTNHTKADPESIRVVRLCLWGV